MISRASRPRSRARRNRRKPTRPGSPIRPRPRVRTRRLPTSNPPRKPKPRSRSRPSKVPNPPRMPVRTPTSSEVRRVIRPGMSSHRSRRKHWSRWKGMNRPRSKEDPRPPTASRRRSKGRPSSSRRIVPTPTSRRLTTGTGPSRKWKDRGRSTPRPPRKSLPARRPSRPTSLPRRSTRRSPNWRNRTTSRRSRRPGQ